MDNISDEKNEVLEVAERMFLERGYAATKLRDLAAQLKMKPASLYYHAPGGKEQLWQMVLDRVLQRHHTNIVAVVQQAGSDLRNQLYAIADWLLSQPPVSTLSLYAKENTPSENFYVFIAGSIAGESGRLSICKLVVRLHGVEKQSVKLLRICRFQKQRVKQPGQPENKK